MTDITEAPTDGAVASADEPHRVPRDDLWGGVAWITLAVAILVASIRMDRLQDQDINPYTIPGLLPGLLSLLMLFFGSMLALRGLLAGGLHAVPGPASSAASAPGRTLLVIGLCAAFDVLLVGHGLPFWAAAAIFVAVAVLALERSGAGRNGRLPTAAAVVKAIVIGLATGGAATALFQQVFLVHLP